MIFDAIASARSRLSGTTHPDQWFVDWARGGQPTASGEAISEETALTCAAVFAANKILSETVACLPLEIFERLSGGGKEPAYDHWAYRMVHDEPNEEVSSFNWRETGQGHLGTWGNAYSEIQRTVAGQPVALWGISPRPETMKPFRDAKDNRVKYRYRPEAGGPEKTLQQHEVLHVPGFGFDGIIGYSPVSLMREPIGSAKASERYAAELFANHAANAGVLQHPGQLGDKAYKRLQDAMAARAEHGKRHKHLIIEEGATFAGTSMNPSEVQLIEARRFGIEEIARAYRISLHLLQEFTEGAASYSSIVELGREFIVYTMMPWLKRWCAEINRKLLDADHFAEFNVAGFLEGDHAGRSEFYNKIFQVGGMTVNEIRAKESLNPIGPEGDVHFVPMNIQPLERAVEEPEPPPIPPLPGQEEEPPEEDDDETPPQFQSAIDDIRAEYDELARRRQARAAQAARQVIGDVCAWLLHKERNAAMRAARQPKRFQDWRDEFYAAHQQTMAEALHNPLAALAAASDSMGDVSAAAGQIAAQHCEASRRALLKAAECTPDELPESVASTVERFEISTEIGEHHGHIHD